MFLLCPSLLLVALNFARLNFTNLHVTQIKRSVFNSIFNLLVFFCFICLSIYLSIFLSIYLSIYLSIDRSIDRSLYLSIPTFVRQWRCNHFHLTLPHFSPVFHFYAPWKQQKTFWFSDVFRGYKNRTLG